MPENSKVSEPEAAYAQLKPLLSNPFHLMEVSKKGLDFQVFQAMIDQSPFSMKEWAALVQLTERTLQRYKAENIALDPIYSERVLSIAQVLKKGESVFGDLDRFNYWLNADNIALGGVNPKSLLDSTFGIQILKDELLRIEHGIFA